MPSEKNIRNAEILTEKLSKAKAVYFTEYLGLNVGELTNLRSHFFKAGVEYYVAKNSLLKLAIENNKLNVSDEIFAIHQNHSYHFGDFKNKSDILTSDDGKNNKEAASKLCIPEGSNNFRKKFSCAQLG